MAELGKSFVLPEPRLDVFDNFPGWDKATALLKQLIRENKFKNAADVGGGANPLLDEAFIKENGIDYALLDVSQVELNKAPAYYRKIQVDMTATSEEFSKRVGGRQFDLIFSHMFLEHISDPLVTHRNIYAALRPGGLAVHFYPTPHNLPMTINRLLPEWFTGALLSIAQPTRDRSGKERKFPAFYAMCGHPTKALHAKFRGLGFEVVRHTSYIGHDYYLLIPVLREIEHGLRAILLKAGIPITGDSLLILQKPMHSKATAFEMNQG
jgi:SAM-dependent methyltransferase